jgi:GGDEF domain-containing protein
MISIQESLQALDRADRLRVLTLDCYVTAIKNAAHYALEIEEPLTGPYRRHLEALAAEVTSDGPEALDRSRATLRALLRDYRDKAGEYLSRLREELAGSAKALQELVHSLCSSTGDHEKRVKEALIGLRAIGSSPEASAVAPMLFDGLNAVETSLEEIHKQHQFTVAQLLSEIRVLQRRVDSLEAAAAVGSLTQLLRRGQMEERIRESAGGSFCLLLMRVTGMREPGIAAELAGAVCKRLRNCLPPAAVIGRWAEDQFIAMLSATKIETMAKARWVAEHLSGVYTCVYEGKTVRPALQVSVAVVDSATESPARTLERVGAFFSRR